MFLRPIAFAVLACAAAVVSAQERPLPRYQLYGGYSYLSNSYNGVPGARKSLNGWDSSLAFSSWHGLRFKLDVASYLGTNTGASQNSLMILAGAQYTVRLGRESLFVEGLAGNADIPNRYWGPNKLPGTDSSFASLLGGGVDTPIGKRLAVRVSGGYVYTNFWIVQSASWLAPVPYPGLPRNFGRVATGLVWGF